MTIYNNINANAYRMFHILVDLSPTLLEPTSNSIISPFQPISEKMRSVIALDIYDCIIQMYKVKGHQ